jgi:hypothetical protein
MRAGRRLAILAIGNLLLGGGIAVEWLAQQNDDLPPNAYAGAPFVDAPQPPAADFDDDAKLVGFILDRPLFSPDRRSAAARSSTAPTRSRLEGIVVWPEAREAVFADDRKARRLLHEGEAIEGWIIEKIDAFAVTLRAGASSAVIQPIQADKHAGKPAPPGAATRGP